MPRDLLPINRHKREGIAEEISHPVWVKKKKRKKRKSKHFGLSQRMNIILKLLIYHYKL